jgi:Glutathione S-transferase
MKLFHSTTSPYVRKVMVVAIETGLDPRIERVATNIQAPTDAFLAVNPLAKVPALIADDGQLLYDSPVICAYLDSLHSGSPLFPKHAPASWQALRQQALADGILDAAVLCRWEQVMRPEPLRWPDWLARNWSKVVRGLDALEAEAAGLKALSLNIGQIAVGCALGWLDYRFPDGDWRHDRSALAAWYEGFAGRPSMQATVPHEG